MKLRLPDDMVTVEGHHGDKSKVSHLLQETIEMLTKGGLEYNTSNILNQTAQNITKLWELRTSDHIIGQDKLFKSRDNKCVYSKTLIPP